MGKGDNKKPRDTLELDPVQLAALTKQPVPGAVAQADLAVSLGRTNTLVDPLTTSLLAEVARRSQTQEFDDEVIEDMLEDVGKPSATEPAHPHTTRRAK